MGTPLKIIKVPITLDKDRTLVYDLNAFEVLEDLYGDLDVAFDSFGSGTHKIKNLKRFLFAGLLHEDKTLTLDKVGSMIGFQMVAHITDQITNAITGAMPEDDGSAPSGE